MKEKEFERRLDKKIQGHAKIMSDEKRKKDTYRLCQEP